MKHLAGVTTGIIRRAALVFQYGIEGIGKSSWAAGAPSPIFLGPEEGTYNLNVSRFSNITSWDSAQSALNELIQEKHNYKTVVIDTVDWLELYLHKQIVGNSGKNINTVNGGYGAGRDEAKKQFVEMLDRLATIRDKGINVLMLGHAEVETVNDPMLNSSYHKFQPKLDKRVSGVLREFCDDVLFATFKAYAKEQEKGMTKTFSDGVRVVYTEWRPAFYAKNRSGLPFEMALDWKEFVEYRERGQPNSIPQIMQRIDGLLTVVQDEDLKKKALETIEKNKTNAAMLEAIANRLEVRLGSEGAATNSH